MKTWIKKLIAWLENLADEGKQDMSGIQGEVVTIASDGVHAVEHVVTNAVSGVETIVKAAERVPNEIVPLEAAADVVLAKVKTLLDGSQQTVNLWTEITAVATALHSDVDAVLAKVKDLLAFSEQPIKALDEIFVLAKKLAAG